MSEVALDVSAAVTTAAQPQGSTLLLGANRYHGDTVMRQRVDIRPPGGKRDAAGRSMPEVLLKDVLDLEQSARQIARRLEPIAYGEIHPVGPPGLYDLVWDVVMPGVSRQAGRLAIARLGAAHSSFRALVDALETRARRRRLTPATAALAAAAQRLEIPSEILGDSYLRIGQGRLQQTLYAASPALNSAAQGATGEDAVRLASRLLRDYLEPDFTGRLPVTIVIGTARAAAISRAFEGLLRATRAKVGLCTPERIAIAGRRIGKGEFGRQNPLRYLLTDQRVEQIVCATSPRKVRREGCVLTRSDVVAILPPARRDDVSVYRREVMATARTATRAIVIDADNPLTEALLRGSVPVVLVSSNARHPLARQHRNAGGSFAIGTNKGHIELGNERSSIKLKAAAENDAKTGDLLYAVAIAHGMDHGSEKIRRMINLRLHKRL